MGLLHPLLKPAAPRKVSLQEGIPFYLQFLGRELGRFGGESVDLPEIDNSFDQFLLQEGDILFAEQINHPAIKRR